MGTLKTLKSIVALLLMLTMLAGCSALRQDNDDNKKANSQKKADNAEETTIEDEIIETEPQLTEHLEIKPATTEPKDTEPEESEPEATIYIEPPVEKSVLDEQYVLTQVASFDDFDKLAFSSAMPVVRRTGGGENKDYLYSYIGNLMIQEPCNNYDYFGEGITAMINYNGIIPSCRLVNINTGEVYLNDPSIAIIKELNDRYFYTIHLEKMVSESENYFISLTEGFADSEVIYYTGYGQVYDIQNKRFVEGLRVSEYKTATTPVAIGSSVFTYKSFETYDMYMPAGNRVVKKENIKITGFTENGFVYAGDLGTYVYDVDGELITIVENANPLSDHTKKTTTYITLMSEKYFCVANGDEIAIVDINGKCIMDSKRNFRLMGDYIMAKNNMGQEALYFIDGKQLLPFSYQSIYNVDDSNLIRMEGFGDSSKKYYYVPGCGLRETTGYSSYENFIRKTGESSGQEYLIHATGDTMVLTKAYEISNSTLIKCDQGLIDIATGYTLVEPGYDYLAVTEEYVYIFQNDQWNVYRLDKIVK